MVVVQHEQLHNALWGPAVRDGRTKRSDVVVFVQMALLVALGLGQLYEYDKPVAARLAACVVAHLLYFRSVALYVRLILLLSLVVAYGDIFVPARRFLSSGESISSRQVPLLMYMQLLFNNGKIVYSALRTLAAAASSRKASAARHTAVRKQKAA